MGECKSIKEIKDMVVYSPEYRFLKNNENIQGNKYLKLLGLSGSYAYGIPTPESDIDIRGVAVNSRDNILKCKDFKGLSHKNTDTVIYSANTFVNMLLDNKPVALELLGLNLNQLIYADFEFMYGVMSLESQVLSKKVVKTYGGYINSLKEKIKTEKDEKALGKKQADILRLYYTCLDILKIRRILTYRRDEKDLLLEVRNGKYITDGEVSKEYTELIDKLEDEFQFSAKRTFLPEEPNYDSVYKWLIHVNEDVVLRECKRNICSIS